MPYSITTRDGITINNIPDDVSADSPQLKERVAKIRGEGAPGLATDPSAAKGGKAAGFGMGLRDAVDAGAQLLRRVVPDGVGEAVDTFGNYLASKGLPVAPSEGVKGVDDIVKRANQEYEQSRQLAGREGFDAMRLAGNVANPVNLIAAPEMAAAKTVGQLALKGAQAGAAGAAMQPVLNTDNFWGEKAGQVATGAATGAVATPILAKAAEAGAKGIQAARTAMRPTVNVDVAVNNVLRSQGLNAAEAPEVILDSVRRQVNEALQNGQRLDPAALVRRAEFEAVGLTGDAGPTLGQLSRNPMQFAQEKNLSGVVIKTPQGQGNPLADRFNTQNRRLQEVFDQAGARGATDRVTAGQTMVDALREADAPVRAGVDEAYQAARAMNNGRAADLERGTFSQAANQALDEGMFGAFLPADVRTLLNQVSEGKTPFNVDAAVQIDTLLSQAQRRADRAGDAAAARAVGVVRDALHATPLAQAEAAAAARAPGAAAATGAPSGAPQLAGPAVDRAVPALRDPYAVGQVLPQVPRGAEAPLDTGAAARAAFDQARRAARDRFATIEATPALKAALDDAAPDKFVQKFIIGADVRDVQSLRNVLQNSPEALGQARAQIADHLKRAAFGGNQSGDAGFAAARYGETLRSMGRQKLEVFFTPAEIVRMNLAGKVASDISSIPAGAQYAVNKSGSGSAIFNLLSKISESPVMRQIPGGRLLANQVGEIQTERSINRALSPVAEQQARELSPEAVRALQRLFPLLGTAAGSAGGAPVQ